MLWPQPGVMALMHHAIGGLEMPHKKLRTEKRGSIKDAGAANETGGLERAKGIEPSYEAWEASVLPLNYARIRRNLYTRSRPYFASENRSA